MRIFLELLEVLKQLDTGGSQSNFVFKRSFLKPEGKPRYACKQTKRGRRGEETFTND